jgi:hypothetical protein
LEDEATYCVIMEIKELVPRSGIPGLATTDEVLFIGGIGDGLGVGHGSMIEPMVSWFGLGVPSSKFQVPSSKFGVSG